MRIATCILAAVFAWLPLWGGFSQVELANGGLIEGDVVRERSGYVIVDLGFTLLSVPREAIAEILPVQPEGEPLSEADTGQLYRTAGNRPPERPVRELVEELGEAVILVETPTGLGSGFVINPEGFVVTNDHVIAGEHDISVTVFEEEANSLVRRQFDNVRIVATNAAVDLALLKIEPQGEQTFTFAKLGNSGELRTGQPVFTIGSPLGLDRSVSRGIVSMKNRPVNGRLFIQTTAEISPGNSGGPLFNLRGEVVGVNNMKVVAMGAEGLGFAIPTGFLRMFLQNRDAFAFDPRNPNAGFRYNEPPRTQPASEKR